MKARLGGETPSLFERLLTRLLPPGVLFELLGIEGTVELVASPAGGQDRKDRSPAPEQDETASESVERLLVSQEAASRVRYKVVSH